MQHICLFLNDIHIKNYPYGIMKKLLIINIITRMIKFVKYL